MKVFTVEELKAIIRKHSEGECADLSYAYLRGANLNYADLRGANLSGANLSDANLSGANLNYADLRGANLSGANLRGANLIDANLSDANLRYANLSGADLRGANLNYADLRGANLILVGQDIRGYLFWAFIGDSGTIEIQAGCRHFVGVNAARLHWTKRHPANAILHEDCLSLVDRAERMARARGWNLEPEEVKP